MYDGIFLLFAKTKKTAEQAQTRKTPLGESDLFCGHVKAQLLSDRSHAHFSNWTRACRDLGHCCIDVLLLAHDKSLKSLGSEKAADISNV